MKTVLFVCTGNTCRSPMAEALLNKYAADAGADIRAESAGLTAAGGAPASKNAVTAASELGADLSRHRSRMVTKEMLEKSSIVYAMTAAHADMLKAAFPEYAGKISVLGSGIPDPYGGSLEIYRKCRNTVLQNIKKIIEQVK